MGITFGDHLIDSGHYDITPEQERERWAREECKRRGIDPDENCADGGIDAWMIVAKETLGLTPSDPEPFDGLGEPRRCDTGLVGPWGQCCACDAAQGEHCRADLT
ncbi:hypothetical protein [Mesorhizobium sp.]|uniref:hypothetical protein n=1 Tax=Mesorhizobium sp. TaxID=1871066 RepID=UPI000FE844DF|nr:hypothetical protein [Mesorhizobium sp.]RWG36829.1 MAG: hypothetical protein EOQ60_03865 [Mesorhizobium sp.]